MRKLAYGFVLVAIASVSQAQIVLPGSAKGGLPEAKKFSVVIERNGLEWRARCEMGCAWTGATLAFSCKENCDAILDAYGLVTAKTAPGNAAFSFLLSADSDGRIIARPRAGTRWLKLGWSCKKDPCTVRVNESGVQTNVAALGLTPDR